MGRKELTGSDVRSALPEGGKKGNHGKGRMEKNDQRNIEYNEFIFLEPYLD